MAKSKRQTIASRVKNRAYKVAIAAAIIALGAGTCTAIVRADSCSSVSDCNAQIANLSNQNAAAQGALDSLVAGAQTYQDAINQLQQQIDTVDAAITANQTQQAALQQKIADYQQKIDLQKQLLGDDIKAMYVNGGMSSVEMLASSDNLSDYVDQQEYRGVIQSKIQSMLNDIAQLEAQVKDKESQVASLIQSESVQKNQLAAAQAQQSQLLSYNQQQQDSYNQQLASNNAQIAKLQQQRAAALASITGSGGRSAVGSPIRYKNFTSSYSMCGGGYSFCGAGFDQPVFSPAWGSGLAHECVNFVSDWLARNGFQGPYNPGNADMWPGYGTVVSSSQVQVGDVAYMPIPPVGHVGVVVGINGDGTFHIEQMNWPVPGDYSEMDLYPQNVTFIQFPR